MANLFLNGIEIPELMLHLKIAVREVLSESSNQPQDDELLTPREVCETLSISLSTLWRYSKSKKLNKLGIGGRIYYKKAEVLTALKTVS